MIRPLYIFDLDGTLSLAYHRLHYIEQEPKNWDSFYASCVHDAPNKPVVDLMNNLLDADNDVWIFTGRSNIVRSETINWLATWTQFYGQRSATLVMRDHGDHTEDVKLKLDWYRAMTSADKNRLSMTFDDRDRVVQMWRDNGIACLQVAPGKF